MRDISSSLFDNIGPSDRRGNFNFLGLIGVASPFAAPVSITADSAARKARRRILRCLP